jgi:hypothetical protein
MTDKLAAPKDEQEQKPIEQLEVYPGAPRLLPKRDKLPILSVVCGTGYKIGWPSGWEFATPKDAKWKTLRKWAVKACRQFHRLRKANLTVGALCAYAADLIRDEEKKTKVCNRLRAIFTSSVEEDRLRFDATVAKAKEESENERKAKEEEKKTGVKVHNARVGKDRFGFRNGTNASKVNAVLTEEPKSIDRIRKESGVDIVINHLLNLRRMGVVKRTKKKRYYVPPVEAPKQSKQKANERKSPKREAKKKLRTSNKRKKR